MQHRAINVFPSTPVSRFDTVIEWLMFALLAFMPLAFGVVHAWSEMVVVSLAAAMSTCLGLKLACCHDIRFVWTWAYLPMALFLLLAVFQLMPLPTWLVATISPQTVATKTTLLAPEVPLDSMTMSFYPNATRHALRLTLAVSAVFVVVVNVYCRPDQIKRLLAAIAIIGGCIALLALAQVLTGTEKIFWFVSTRGGKATGGTFANYGHFSQFINLSMGCALALLLMKLSDLFPPGSFSGFSTLKRCLQDSSALPFWFLAVILVLGAASVFLSLSRGGMISVLVAGAFTTIVLASRKSLSARVWVMILIGLAAFVFLLHAGFDAVYDRLVTLHDVEDSYAIRWQILKDITAMASQFPFLGTGLGTHEVVYPMFEHATHAAVASHAENEYAQTLEETGVIGLCSLVFFGAVVWFNYARLIRRPVFGLQPVAIAVGFSLMAVMIHSFTDFGQHLPANACLTAIICALIVRLPEVRRRMSSEIERRKTTREATPSPNPALKEGRGVFGRSQHSEVSGQNLEVGGGASLIGALSCVRGFVALALLIPAWSWAIFGANNARAAERHWRTALRHEEDMHQNGWIADNADYANLISAAAAAADSEPDNVEYRYWLNVYRWRSISRIHDPKTGALVMTPRSLEFTQRIISEFHEARRLCPTFGPTYCVVGQLEMLVLGQPSGAVYIRKGFQLAPNHATACFVAGWLDAHEMNAEASLSKFRRALELDSGLFQNISEVYVNQLDRPDLALDLAGHEAWRLFRMAEMLSEKDEHHKWAEQARAKAVQALKTGCQKPDAPASMLAALADLSRKDDDYASAIAYYRRALARDYEQVDWRLACAQTLAANGQIDQAMQEARLCLRLRPQMTAAKNLIADLSLRVSDQ